VKSCLGDQMLLQQQIQGLEEDAIAAKAVITRLTRELEERKFVRHNKEEKDKKLSDMQREVSKLQHEIAMQKESVLNSSKLQSDLAAAEKVTPILTYPFFFLPFKRMNVGN
jgi:predicted RNase H-like nuclease (RuvC/YqgF family)